MSSHEGRRGPSPMQPRASQGDLAVRELVGAVHIHSTYSDGSGTVGEIARAARGARLDFVLLTDHDTLAPLTDVGDRFMEGVFVGFGAEVTPPKNHYLAFGLSKGLPPRDLDPQEIIDRVSAEGGFGFLAHPMDRGSRVLNLPSYAWTAKDARGFLGLEVWNVMSDWIGLTQTVPATLRALVRPNRHLTGPDPALLAWWDRLNLRRPVPGIGGLDVHAYRMGPLTVYPYRRSFGMVLMHVQVREAPTDDVPRFRAGLLEGLRQGRSYFANHALLPPDGFRFAIGDAGPGEAIPFAPGLEAQARLASFRGASWRLVVDGHPVPGGGPVWPVTRPGVYRLEGRVGGRPWLFTNPVRVQDG